MKKKLVIVGALVVLLDLITKTWVQQSLGLYESIPIIPGFFSITYLTNTGAAWSILDGQRWFFIVLASGVTFVLSHMFIKEKEDRYIQIGLALMIAGTFGNLFDRIVHGYVRDMLSFVIFGYDFPVFNVADISLVIGVGFICLAVLLEEIRERKQKQHD